MMEVPTETLAANRADTCLEDQLTPKSERILDLFLGVSRLLSPLHFADTRYHKLAFIYAS